MLEFFISLFGMSKPSSNGEVEITTEEWRNFLGSMEGYIWLLIGVSVILTVGAYALTVRRRTLHTPADFFQTFVHNWWLVVAVATWGVMFMILMNAFHDKWPHTADSAAGYAAIAASVAALITFVLASAAMLIPGVTPHYLRYRPWAAIFLGRGKKDTKAKATS